MADLLLALSEAPYEVRYALSVIGAVLCIVGIVLGLNQYVRKNEPEDKEKML